MKSKFLVLPLIVGSFALNAADIEISNIYAKATPPNTKNSAMFFNIKNNTNQTIKLISVSSSASKTSELHTHLHKDGMMEMVQVDSIEVPANGETKLMPGGLHVMLMDINAPIKEGDKIEATLGFDNGEKITIKGIEAKAVVKKDHNHNHDGHSEHKHNH